MTIGIVGGVERQRVRYERLAEAHGHRCEYHPGRVGGRGTEVLRAMIARVDLVVVITDVVGHGAAAIAKRETTARALPLHLMRRCSVTSFLQMLGGDA